MLDLSVALTKQHFATLVRTGIGPLTLLLGCDIVLRVAVASRVGDLFGYLLTLVLVGIAEARMIAVAWAVLHERPVEPGLIREQVRQNLPAILLASVLKGTVFVLGFMLLIVPGVWLLLVLFAVPTVTVLEGRGLWSSVQRSRILARGRKRRLLATIGFFDVTMLVVLIIVTKFYSNPGTGKMLWWAAAIRQVAVLLLLPPIRATLMTVMYADARIHLEGYDLEVTANQLSDAGAA